MRGTPDNPINLDQAEQDAFELGLEYSPVEDMEGFESSSIYANTVLPELRRLAGYGDIGVGTHRVNQTVYFTADDYDGVDRAKASAIMSDHVMKGWRNGVNR